MNGRTSLTGSVLLAIVGWANAADPPAKEVSPDLVATGSRVFNKWCAPCHAPGGGHAGTMALAVRLGKGKSVLLERRDLAAVYVRTVIRNGFQMMPPFKETEISDAEAEAVAAFVASAGGTRPLTP